MDGFTEPLVGGDSLYSLHRLGCKTPPFGGLCTRMLHVPSAVGTVQRQDITHVAAVG